MKTPFGLQQYFATKQAQHHQLLDEESERTHKMMVKEIEIDGNMCKKQASLVLDNTPVYFPHQPYDVQKSYMESVIRALNKKQNALLESPTGTGKTLSLLCASLAWLKKNRKDQLNSDQPKNIKIIYSSRTHAQLKQVAMELKKTVYKPNVSMLGSRDQYCIRGDFSAIKGTLLNQSCRKSVKSNQCQFYKKEHLILMAQNYSTLISSLDEAKQFGFKNKLCPYYFERQRLDFADLILLPYNYLLEKDFQDVVEIENSILIFDEAHNVQSTAEEGSSFLITHNNIIEAEKDLEKWIDELESVSIFYDQLKAKLNSAKVPTELKEFRSIMITIRVFAQYIESFKNNPEFVISDKDEKYLISDARRIQNMIFEHTQDKENTFRLWSENSQTNYAKGVNKNNFAKYLIHCSVLIEVMGELSQIPGYHFESWVKFMKNVFDLIKVEDEREKQKLSLNSLQNEFNQYKLSFILDQSNQLSINMWCLEPSLAFSRLFSKSIYSILLTSGTLSPMPSWACELRIPFEVQLVNEHIIDLNKNLRVFQHKTFDFSFNQRNNEEQVSKFGVTLLSLSQIIPNGILVIFSSYSLMNKFRSKWTYNKLLPRLCEIKACLWEPQQSAEMQNVFDLYKQKSKKGAIMFAVHRGKVAEGIDFSDELCRAIFLVGVPYPPKQDNHLLEKMGYLDKIFNDPEFTNQQRIKSSEWYTQQAIRATNQAMGRVIRHINDYGIVYLCDKRFEYRDIKQGLSKWAQPAIQPWVNDDEVIKQTKEFYNRTISIKEQCIKEQIEQKPIQEQDCKKRKLQFFGLQNKNDFEKLKDETQERVKNLNEQQQQNEYINLQSYQMNYKPQEQQNKNSNKNSQKQLDISNFQNINLSNLDQNSIQEIQQKMDIDDDQVSRMESKKKKLCIRLKNQK
ncbi:unnamed protein product (macronuclear) [Paramecium tetraurelia]|uniref:Helicase ATP-binding domain-containing protein n=1 Tax=Paramecium tetraurelia TaxID=5888 RepID=A0D1W6_PARTE|nr:uncharacterized protein GSPATT00012558001 [Paramecium tetraurelia]CAK77033.1 unnamed protein product [Paramecium tetraurelia]|eukprot:XP_001444430.1 hypothetical protein (macronuclear) [Paramecium tetraurelia strain d4-2]